MAHVKALNPTAIKASEDASESASRTIGRTIASTNIGQAIHSLITGVMCVCVMGEINNTWRLHVAQNPRNDTRSLSPETILKVIY